MTLSILNDEQLDQLIGEIDKEKERRLLSRLTKGTLVRTKVSGYGGPAGMIRRIQGKTDALDARYNRSYYTLTDDADGGGQRYLCDVVDAYKELEIIP